MYGTGWQRVQCFGHRLHLAVTRSLRDAESSENIKLALSSMKKVITHFSHSHKKRRSLTEAQVIVICLFQAIALDMQLYNYCRNGVVGGKYTTKFMDITHITNFNRVYHNDQISIILCTIKYVY